MENKLHKSHAQSSKKEDKDEQKKRRSSDRAPKKPQQKNIESHRQIQSSEDDLSSNEYLVEKIIDRRNVEDRIEYLVKWEGYTTDDATWEPRENLDTARLAIEKYEKTLQSHSQEKQKEKTKKGASKKEQEPIKTKKHTPKFRVPADTSKHENDPGTKVATHDDKRTPARKLGRSTKSPDSREQEHEETTFTEENKVKSTRKLKKLSKPSLEREYEKSPKGSKSPSSDEKEPKFAHNIRKTKNSKQKVTTDTLRKIESESTLSEKPMPTLKEKISNTAAASQLTARVTKKNEKSSHQSIIRFEKMNKYKESRIQNEKDFAIQFDDLPCFGHFLWDKPQKIVHMEFNNTTNDLDVYIDWLPRPNGLIPQPTKVSRLDLLKYDPLLLIYHYEKGLTLENCEEVNFEELLKIESKESD